MRARRRRLKRNRIAVQRLKPSTELVPIPPENVLEVWHLISHFIEAGCRDCETDAEQLRDEAASAKAQLWVAYSDDCEAAAITRLIVVQQGLICLIVSCGGVQSDHWLGLLDELELWAKRQGCVGMRLIGRLGWYRKLHDFELSRIIMDKRL